MRMRIRSRKTSRGKENKVDRRWRCYGEGSETRNLDGMHTKVGWQEVDLVDGRGRGEEGKEAQLTRDFKQKTKVEKQRQNRIEIMTYRRIDHQQQGRGLHTRGRGHGSQFSSGQGEEEGGRWMFPCLSFKMHTMGVPSLDFGRAARPRARWASHLPPCHPFQLQPWQGSPMLLYLSRDL